MKTFKLYLALATIIGLLSSCTVTNNLYVNNPVPMGKGNGEFYAGIGTGIEAKIDSVSVDSIIFSSGKTSIAPVLSVGVQFGVLKHMDIRAAIHFPYVVGGFGLRVGAQYSFFDSISRFHAAIGTDLSFTTAKDSLHLFGSSSAMNPQSKGAISADFFLPVSFKVADHFNIILTPRYSLNSFYMLKNEYSRKSKRFGLSYPALTLGIRIYNFYLESTAVYYNNTIYPHAGISCIIPLGSD